MVDVRGEAGFVCFWSRCRGERDAAGRPAPMRGDTDVGLPMVMVGSGPARVANSSPGRKPPARSGDCEMSTGSMGAEPVERAVAIVCGYMQCVFNERNESG